MKYLSRLLIALTLAVLPTVASAQLQLINCAPGTPCTIVGPSATGTGDQAWLAFGKANQNFLSLQSQIQTVFGGNSGGVYYFNGIGLASSNTLATNQLLLGGGVGNGPFGLGSLGTSTTVLHGNSIGAPAFSAVNQTTDITGVTPVGNGGIGVGVFTGIPKGNGTSPFTPAIASDVGGLFSGAGPCFLNKDGTCSNPAGSGTVTTTGSPANGNLALFSGATSVTNGDLSGDCTTSGALVIGCTKIGGKSVTLSNSFTTTGAFGLTLAAQGTTTATFPSGTMSVGYLGCPQTGGAVKTASYPAALADAGTCLNFNCAGACTATIPANASVAFPIGTQLSFHVLCAGTNALTIAITSDTLYWMSSPVVTGSRTLAICGFATAYKETATTWAISGQLIT